jgi:hypothetical protein
MMQLQRHDVFLAAYVEAALWSSTLPPYGPCPGCQRLRILDHWRDAAYGTYVCEDCGDRQSPYEPAGDSYYTPADFSPCCRQRMQTDCERFQREHWPDIAANLVRAGHDFWFTREGHGSGFWDGDWPDEVGERLTAACDEYGSCPLHVGDDGKIYAL